MSPAAVEDREATTKCPSFAVMRAGTAFAEGPLGGRAAGDVRRRADAAGADHLLKNAVEAGGPPEGITLSIAEVPAGAFEVRVEDRGKGMRDDVMKNALLPFIATKPSGSGLGLLLCREIVEAHGGTLSIRPRVGGGISVVCLIP